MIVMKFGGSSLCDRDAVDRVAGIVADRLALRPAVVVSAVGDTTDDLAAVLERVRAGDAHGARDAARAVRLRHEQVMGAVLPEGPERRHAAESLGSVFGKLERLIEGMDCLGEVSPRSSDAVLALGEIAAAPLIASFLSSRGLPAEAVDPREIILTDAAHGRAVPIVDASAARCAGRLRPMLEAGRLPVIGGYVGATAEGVTTTLGRGGSDLTASLVARALGADDLEFWKDVDGILTADPGIVPEARPVPRLSFEEAAELAFLGARVLHPASIQPAVEAGVPVRVKNSYRRDAPGTLITRERSAGPAGGPSRAVVSIACKLDQILVNVFSTRMLGASGFLRRVFEVFERLDLSVDHIATSEVNVSVTLCETPRAAELASRLGEVAEVEVRRGVGVVSVVGDRIRATPGVAARLFGALGDINVLLITHGGSGVNLSFVVESGSVPLAVRRLHAALFEDGRA